MTLNKILVNELTQTSQMTFLMLLQGALIHQVLSSRTKRREFKKLNRGSLSEFLLCSNVLLYHKMKIMFFMNENNLGVISAAISSQVAVLIYNKQVSDIV